MSDVTLKVNGEEHTIDIRSLWLESCDPRVLNDAVSGSPRAAGHQQTDVMLREG